MPQRSAKRLRRAYRFPGGARWRKPWAPQQPAASPLRQPKGVRVCRHVWARTSGKVPQRTPCAPLPMSSRSVHWKGSPVQPLWARLARGNPPGASRRRMPGSRLSARRREQRR
jgi:hypothetical protein